MVRESIGNVLGSHVSSAQLCREIHVDSSDLGRKNCCTRTASQIEELWERDYKQEFAILFSESHTFCKNCQWTARLDHWRLFDLPSSIC